MVVQEGVQKVFSSFAEALRREAMKVSQAGGGPRTVSICLLVTCSCIVIHLRAVTQGY